MNAPTKFHFSSKHVWTTVDVDNAGERFILEERSRLNARRHTAEIVVSLIVGSLFLGSYLLAILPDFTIAIPYSGVSTSLAVIFVALALYAFATRGHKRQVGFDKSKNMVWTCKLNSKGHARFVSYFPKANVRSVFIRRPEGGSKDAVLLARITGKNEPVTLLCGSQKDIEAAHFELCRVLREVAVLRPARPVQKVIFRKSRSAPSFTACAV